MKKKHNRTFWEFCKENPVMIRWYFIGAFVGMFATIISMEYLGPLLRSVFGG